MKKRILLLILTFLLLFALSGCESMLRRDFSYSAQHAVPSSSTNVVFSNIADYDSLVEAIETMVSMCRTEQTFSLLEFSDDIEGDIKAAIRQVQSTPLGSYAISSILYKTSLILNHYELSFSVTYNCTAEELRGIRPVSSKMELKNALSDALSEFKTKLLFQAENYLDLCSDIDSFILERYYINPLYAIGYADHEYKAFPSPANPQLVELRILYTEPAVLLSSKVKSAEAQVEMILEDARDLDTTVDALRYFHDLLCTRTQYDTDTEQILSDVGFQPRTAPFTIYGTLVEQSAVSEGYALTFKELCDRYGITCVLANGAYQGVGHMWNRVYVDQKWYNIDCSADAIGEDYAGYRFFCATDDEMTGYSFSPSTKRYCKSTLIRDQLSEEGMDPEILNASRYTEE